MTKKYYMPFIKDKDLYKAIVFAKRLIVQEGMAAGLANYKAAKYYDVNVSKVARYVGTFAVNKKNRKDYRG